MTTGAPSLDQLEDPVRFHRISSAQEQGVIDFDPSQPGIYQVSGASITIEKRSKAENAPLHRLAVGKPAVVARFRPIVLAVHRQHGVDVTKRACMPVKTPPQIIIHCHVQSLIEPSHRVPRAAAYQRRGLRNETAQRKPTLVKRFNPHLAASAIALALIPRLTVCDRRHGVSLQCIHQRAQRTGQAQPTIIVRRARPGERMTTLDDVERALTTDMLLIADTAGAIAVAGVMGGQETEVNERTVNVLLESACFNNINNRRTAQALKLFSEASTRFGRGIPATLAPLANRRAAQMMADLAGGEVVPGVQDAYAVRQRDITIVLTNAEVERLLGVPVAPADLLRTLEAMECRVAHELGGGNLRVTVPWHRLDLEIPADLVEEVARGIGYDKIPSTLLASALPEQWHNWPIESEEAIRALLTGCGLQDTINYPLISESDNARLLAASNGEGWTEAQAAAGYHLPALLRPADSVQLANPLSVERSLLRSSLLPVALQVMAANLRYRERWAAFDIGRVYWPLAGAALPYEARHVSLVMAGPRAPAWWQGSTADELDFYDLKGVVETLLARIGVPQAQVQFAATAHPAFTRRVARVQVAGQDIGILGELHPVVRRAFDLPAQGRVVAAELALAPLFAAYQREIPMQTISAYPAIKEDLAVIVDEAVRAEQVAEAITAAGGEMLTGLRLFDVYRGDQIGAGQKSLAYRVTYQAADRSLTDADAAKLRAKIVRRLEETISGRLRASG